VGHGDLPRHPLWPPSSVARPDHAGAHQSGPVQDSASHIAWRRFLDAGAAGLDRGGGAGAHDRLGGSAQLENPKTDLQAGAALGGDQRLPPPIWRAALKRISVGPRHQLFCSRPGDRLRPPGSGDCRLRGRGGDLILANLRGRPLAFRRPRRNDSGSLPGVPGEEGPPAIGADAPVP